MLAKNWSDSVNDFGKISILALEMGVVGDLGGILKLTLSRRQGLSEVRNAFRLVHANIMAREIGWCKENFSAVTGLKIHDTIFIYPGGER